MRILIIDNSIAVTGAFKCALNEAELLSASHTFLFLLPSNSILKPYLAAKNIKVYTLPMVEISKSPASLLKYFPVLLSNAFKLKKILKKEKIDVLQVNDFYNMLGLTCKLLGFKGRLITYVRFLPSSRPAPLRKIWSSLAKKHSNKVIAVSDVVLSQLPPSPDTIRIYDPIRLKENLPPKQYIPTNTINILYQGNYIMGKGQDTALEAFALAYKANPNIRLKYVGGDMGLEKNKAFKQRLQHRVNELHLNEVVTFSPFTDNVEETIKSADIVLNFSASESFSMTCLEASFYGTSLIATRCGGPEEIIVNNKTGLLVTLHDYWAMCEAILRLAGDPELRKSFALAAKNLVMQRFPPDKFVQQVQTVLTK